VSTRDLEPTVRQSVLDRLIDTEPLIAGDRPVSWSESVRQLRAAVMRDLDWLLNTRRIAQPAPAEFPEVQASVYHFGLPDISSLSRDAPESRELLLRRIEECLRIFEPRLMNVQVTSPDPGGASHHRIRFSIEALLRMEPNPERIAFDTVLEVTSGEFSVTGTVNE
jgi:type VI secretion system protein ImpF